MWRSAVQPCQGLLGAGCAGSGGNAETSRRKRRGISSDGLEHLPCKQGVKGSSPLFSTEKKGSLTWWQQEDCEKKQRKRAERQKEESQKERIKGVRRMPWLRGAKKDATGCEKPRGGANGRRSGGVRMGEPTRREPRTAAVAAGPTRGTETSQYPQEKKTTVIPRVAASESGGAQTAGVEARRGVVGAPAKQTAEATGTAWKGGPQGVRAPYGKRKSLRGVP